MNVSSPRRRDQDLREVRYIFGLTVEGGRLVVTHGGTRLDAPIPTDAFPTWIGVYTDRAGHPIRWEVRSALHEARAS